MIYFKYAVMPSAISVIHINSADFLTVLFRDVAVIPIILNLRANWSFRSVFNNFWIAFFRF
jgi:hypothetical protein